MNMGIRLVFLGTLLVTVLWTSGPLLADDTTAAAGHRRASPADAAVDFVTPLDGDVVSSTFEVQFSVSGMDISPAGTDQDNSGHHHLLIDVETLPDLNLPLPKDEHFVHFGGGQSETILTLPEGEHTLQLVFADYVHIPHDPVVMSERITITVSAEAAQEN